MPYPIEYRSLCLPYGVIFCEPGIIAMPALKERRLAREIIGLPDQSKTQELLPGQTMLAFVGLFLFEVHLFSDEQVWLILQSAKPVLECVGRQLEELLTNKEPPDTQWQLVLADRRYFSWSTADHWLDIESGKSVDKTPGTPCETISFHLQPIALRMLHRLSND